MSEWFIITVSIVAKFLIIAKELYIEEKNDDSHVLFEIYLNWNHMPAARFEVHQNQLRVTSTQIRWEAWTGVSVFHGTVGSRDEAFIFDEIYSQNI